MAAAFEFCGNKQFREEAKSAATVVLHTLQQMFKGERKREGFVFEDLKRHADKLYSDRPFDVATLKLGLYLAKDLRALSSFGLNSPDDTEVTSFQIGEGMIAMAEPGSEWDRVMEGYKPVLKTAPPAEEISFPHGEKQWEQIKPLGGGGQSDVFLVRSPERTRERAQSIEFLNSFPSPLTAAAAERTRMNTQFAELLKAYTRP